MRCTKPSGKLFGFIGELLGFGGTDTIDSAIWVSNTIRDILGALYTLLIDELVFDSIFSFV